MTVCVLLSTLSLSLSLSLSFAPLSLLHHFLSFSFPGRLKGYEIAFPILKVTPTDRPTDEVMEWLPMMPRARELPKKLEDEDVL